MAYSLHRIGSVPYLNALPLVSELDPTPVLLSPAVLADALHADELDAALVPVAECLLHNEYDLVDGVAIAARNPVYSVIFASEKPPETWKTLALDPASRSSALLTRVIVEKFWKRPIRYVAASEVADARLIIGDPARNYRRQNPQVGVVDLAEEWTWHTQLPFVFAVWAIRRRCSSRGLANYLREVAARGLADRHTLARDEEERVYLTEHISYTLDLPEKQALGLFSQYLIELGLLPELPTLTWI